MAAYEHFAQIVGDVNTQQPGTVLNPYLPWWQQALEWYAGISAQAGARAGGATPAEQGRAGYEASKAPLKAPAEAAQKAAGSLLDLTGLQSWAQQQGRVVGIYGLFVLIGVIGLVFLLSAAGSLKR